VSQPVVEDTRPCPYNPCTGTMEPELDGGVEYFACTTCFSEYYPPSPAEPTCAAGLTASQRTALGEPAPESPAPATWLGQIGRRPE
jgi:hypothetical protein